MFSVVLQGKPKGTPTYFPGFLEDTPLGVNRPAFNSSKGLQPNVLLGEREVPFPRGETIRFKWPRRFSPFFRRDPPAFAHGNRGVSQRTCPKTYGNGILVVRLTIARLRDAAADGTRRPVVAMGYTVIQKGLKANHPRLGHSDIPTCITVVG